MTAFTTLITQVFLIMCLQITFELFIDDGKHINQVKLFNITCYIGSLYLVMDFIFNTLIYELITILRTLFY